MEDIWGDHIGLVIFVPLYGNPSGGCTIKEYCDMKKVPVIFDCAQAHGASTDNNPIGKVWGNCTWSFYPGKNLGAYGDAGAITTNEKRISNEIRMRSNYGSLIKYHHELIGSNSRLDTIQAAVLLRKLNELPAINSIRKKVAQSYISKIKNPLVTLPTIDIRSDSSWHLFVIEVCGERSKFMKYMSEKGVQTSIHYPKTILGHDCFKHLNIHYRDVSISSKLAKSIVSLPMGAHLTDNHTEHVIQTINSWDGANE